MSEVSRIVSDYFFLLGVCASALAAAALSAALDFGLASTLPAAEAAFGPVCRVFFPMASTPFRCLPTGLAVAHTPGC
jgi:hypothetical protein